MDVAATISVASAVGAGLFFASGYVARGMRRITGGVSGDQLEAERRSREFAEAQAAASGRELAEVRARYDESLERLDGEKTAQKADPAVLKASQAEAERLRKEVAAVQTRMSQEVFARQQAEEALDGALAGAPAEDVDTVVTSKDQVLGQQEAPGQWQEERQQLLAQLEAAKAQQQQARVQQEQLKQSRQQSERLRGENQRLRAQAEGAATGTAELEKTRAELEKARAELEKAHVEVGDLRVQVSEAAGVAAEATEAELQAAIRDLQHRLRAAEARAETADALRDETTQLRGDLEAASASAVPIEEVEQLRKKQRDLLLKGQMMNQRIQELQRYADENASLRQQVAGLDDAKATEQALEARVKELEAQLFAGGVAAEKGEDVEKQPASVSEFVGVTIDEQLKPLAADPTCKVAVLADARGLLLGASGERQYYEALAGMSGLIREMADRAHDFLPLATPRVVEISDVNNVGLYCRLFPWENELVALTTLGTRRGELDGSMEGAIASLPSVMRAEAEGKLE